MQNVECRMQNEERTPEIFRNRCHIRSGALQGSGAKGWRVCESCDSYQSYNTNSERGSGISGISGEKSHPFCRRNRGKYAPHTICSVNYFEGSPKSTRLRPTSVCSRYRGIRRDKSARQSVHSPETAQGCSDMSGYVRLLGKKFRRASGSVRVRRGGSNLVRLEVGVSPSESHQIKPVGVDREGTLPTSRQTGIQGGAATPPYRAKYGE